MRKYPITSVEIPFEWSCPRCGHKQTDTVNPESGPFLAIVCEPCGPRRGTFEAREDPPRRNNRIYLPEANVSLARNAAIDAASHDTIVFTDDDCAVQPQWCAQFARRTGRASLCDGHRPDTHGRDRPR